MPAGQPRPPELIGGTLLIALPATVALAALVALQLLAPLDAIGAWLLALLLSSLLAWRRHRSMRDARDYAEALMAGMRAEPPAEAVLGDAELDRTLRRLGRFAVERLEREIAADRMQQALLDALPDPVLLIDGGQMVEKANPAATALFGEPPAGRALPLVLRDPGLLAAVGDALSDGRTSELSLTTGARGERAFAVRVLPVPRPDGTNGALIGLRERTEELQIERMRSDFVAHASHELRTPLSSIRGFIETLRGPAREDADARERFLAIMAGESERMTRLLDDLLSLSRIEQLEHDPPRTWIEPRPVLERVLRALSGYAEERRVRLELVVDGELPEVRADADQLHQVLGNLVDNAIKYGGEGKTVTVRAGWVEQAPPGAGPLARRPALSLAVIDQGEGVPRELLPRLTERFYRVDAGRSRRLGGTGLGLAIVKHAVRRHRGHLALDSEPGRGSTFTVYLPLD